MPDRVALQFQWNGAPRSYGPRWVIWFAVALQIAAAIIMAFAGFALANHAPGTHGSVTGFAIFAVLLNALLLRVQTLLLSAAKSRASRVPMNGFWTFFAVWFALLLIDVLAIG